MRIPNLDEISLIHCWARFWKTDGRHIGIISLVSISTYVLSSACDFASARPILSQLVSWLITRFRNHVSRCWNRATRIRLYSIFFFLNSCLLNWFLLLAPNVVGLHFPHAECGSGYILVFYYAGLPHLSHCFHILYSEQRVTFWGVWFPKSVV